MNQLFSFGERQDDRALQRLALDRQQQDYLQFAPWRFLAPFADIGLRAPGESGSFSFGRSSGTSRSTGSSKGLDFRMGG